MIVPGSASPLLTTTDGAYSIAKSLRLRSSATAYLSRTPASAGSRTTWTWSGWVKRGALSSLYCMFGGTSSTSNAYNTFRFQSDGSIDMQQYVAGVSTDFQVRTTAVYRDPSAWYHIVFTYDSTQATSTNRIKLYVNGSQVTSFQTTTYPAQNTTSYFNNNTVQYIGTTTYNGTTDQPFDGYMSDVNFIDGQALTASSFGETDSLTGVWKPKQFSGTYGTNGFYLKFTDVATTSGSNAGLGKDFSGNGNYWTTNNISVTSGATYDSMKDVPTLTDANTANYAVLNAIANPATQSNGNLTLTGGDKFSISTIGMSSGKWYAEMTVTTVGFESSCGISNQPYSGTYSYVGGILSVGTSYGYYYSGSKYTNGTGTAYGSSYTSGDVIGIAFDADAGTLTFYKNNTSQGTAFTGLTSGPYYFAMSGRTATTPNNVSINFGQQPFVYTPPTGYVGLNTYNLADSTIKAGNKYMDATLYTGTGSSLSVTNAGGFKPDLVWIKSRSAATSNKLTDSVRGATKGLISDTTGAETTDTNGLTAFGSSGFTVGTDTNYNNNTSTYVGWQWQAGQGSTSSNTNGTITSTVSVNATAGFSIVTYTGNGSSSATVGHGLGVTPSMVITKGRSAIVPWMVKHKSLSSNNNLLLHASDVQTNVTTGFTGGGIADLSSSSTFGFLNGTGAICDNSNKSGVTFVAYCWSEIAGFSKFGSYLGNGSVDGNFVYLGFKPKFIIIKRIDSATNWVLNDSRINSYNVTTAYDYPGLSAAEATGAVIMDIVSNGFKLRCDPATYTGFNASSGTFIYMAFAENPFKNSLAR